jgi:hypothetical protein
MRITHTTHSLDDEVYHLDGGLAVRLHREGIQTLHERGVIAELKTQLTTIDNPWRGRENRFASNYGDVEHMGGNVYVTFITLHDGRVIVIGHDVISLYTDRFGWESEDVRQGPIATLALYRD